MFDEIRDRLLRRRTEILQQKSEVVAALIDDVPDRRGDSIDISTQEQTGATALSLQTRAAQELADINAALRRIHDGEFNECDHCGEEIPLRRLQIQPLARLCVECQELTEQDAKRRYKRPGLLDEFE